MRTMNDEMKKLISRFLFASVFISCLTLFFAGSITAKQRSEYNSYRTQYTLLTIKTQDSQIDLSLDEKNYTLDLSGFKSLKKYENLIYLTPISPLFFCFECVFNIFYD